MTKATKDMTHSEWVDMVDQKLSELQQQINALSPSILDEPDLPLTIGLTKSEEQPQEGTDYIVTLTMPADMNIGQWLEKCKEQYYQARGHRAPTTVKVEDCRHSSERMAGLFDQWLIFAYTLGQLNPEVVGYMRDTVAGLKEVMDEAVDELVKRA